ncbi:MAG: HlyD family type I secretion periplasmic adaptor subunit [Hyphomonas sp.]
MVNLSISAPPSRNSRKAFRRNLIIGWFAIISVFGGLVAWSVFAPFEGAVLTQGQISVESNQQAIQHLEGGIVREIFVREADYVEQGQQLLSLDATTTAAGLQALEARLFELLGTEARLLAERDKSTSLVLRESFADLADSPAMGAILSAQRSLLSARSDSRRTQTRILRQRVEQLETRIDGMTREISEKDAQILLLRDEIQRFEQLVAKGLAPEVRVLALRRELSEIEGMRQSLLSDISATRVQIGEALTEISKLSQTFQEDVLTQLRDVQTQIGELTEQRTAAVDRQTRLDIVAPRSGLVIGVRAHTIGGIVNPSEPIMYIVPEGDPLVAKVRVNPVDIDKISSGQKAVLHFTAFNQDETPKVVGHVSKISADALVDEATGQSFYEVIVDIPSDALPSEQFTLVPGMPVDASLRTESRSVLSYLVKPLTDSMTRTFRE